jgi:DNA-binding MarR family transcriptional regulator
MSDSKTLNSSSDNADPAILLGVLSAVESNADVTQRKLSGELGIALGLANAYLKRCVRKGWIKIAQVPMRRYAYFLTPQGFSEKARLTAEYLSWSLEFFRRARRESAELFAAARARGFTRFVIVGAGDLAEVVILSAIDAEADVIGIVDPATSAKRCAGKLIFGSIKELVAHIAKQGIGVDAILVAAAQDPLDAFELAQKLAAALDLPATPDRILLPAVLKIAWPAAAAAEGSGR